jgi:hypothetical protein
VRTAYLRDICCDIARGKNLHFSRSNTTPFGFQPKVGVFQEVGTDLSTFAVVSLWGKFGGLHACAATFPYIVPLPNIFLTRLFSKLRLKRKDFQEILRLPWAQEAPGSNPGAPTTNTLKQLRFFLHCIPTIFELGTFGKNWSSGRFTASLCYWHGARLGSTNVVGAVLIGTQNDVKNGYYYLEVLVSLPQHSGRSGNADRSHPPPRAWTSVTASTMRRPRMLTAVTSSERAAV